MSTQIAEFAIFFLFFEPIVSRLPQTEGPELQPAVIMKLDVEGNVGRMAPQYNKQEFDVKWLLLYQIAAADLIFVIFSPQMYFLGSIFLHMKAC